MLIKTKAQIADEALHATVHGSSTAKLFGAFLGLYTAGPTPAAGSLLANFTEATFTGYARQGVTWNTPTNEPDGSQSVLGNLAVFELSNTTTLNTIVGALIIANDSTTLLAAEQFAATIPLANTSDGFGYIPKMNFAFQPDDSAGVVIQ
jgi:hypothetical protein